MPELFPSGREKVVEYVTQKYGKEKVCHILAMGTMGTKSALKDAGRAMGEDYITFDEINAINKFVPSDSNGVWPLKHCLYGDEEHARAPIDEIIEFAKKYPELTEVAIDFDGVPRHKSVHAAGIVISPVDVTEIFPLARGKEDEAVSQFDKHWVEELGCLKMDFLGLITLGVLHKAVDLVRERHGKVIDLDSISFDDKNVLSMIKNGFTEGVFQIESPGMKSVFKDMNEVTFEDIIVGISLYRPGPMKMIPKYVGCKNGFLETEYLFPELKEVLESTYGIIVYQEQVIQIATKLAGYSEGDADLFRRAIGKKDEELIKQQIDILIHGQEENPDKGKKYIPGLVKNGVDEEKALQLGKDIVSFSAYAFNRSHSAAYAVLTMQTAYMKHYYPVEYMAALISSYIQKSNDKIIQYIQEAQRMGITVLPPDINKSNYDFSIEGDRIRFGFGAIKGVNMAAIKIIKERTTNGPIKDIKDFAERFSKSDVGKRELISLILAGSMDNIYQGKRKDLLKDMLVLREYSDDVDEVIDKTLPKSATGKDAKQLFSKDFKDEFEESMRISMSEMAHLGMYMTAHPLRGKVEPINWNSLYPGDVKDVTGVITNIKKLKIKNGYNAGKDMAIVKVDTLEGEKTFTIFSQVYDKCSNKLEEGGIRTFTIKCERDRRDPDQMSYLVNNIKYFRGDIINENVEIDDQRECIRLAEEALL